MGYDIVTLETQNSGQDWPLIVTAVVCPTCGAGKGEMCRSIGTTEGPTATHPMLTTGQPRIDWHSARKESAAAAWYTRDQSAQQPPEGNVFILSEHEPGSEPPSPLSMEEMISHEKSTDTETEPPKVEEKAKKKGPPKPPPPPASK